MLENSPSKNWGIKTQEWTFSCEFAIDLSWLIVERFGEFLVDKGWLIAQKLGELIRIDLIGEFLAVDESIWWNSIGELLAANESIWWDSGWIKNIYLAFHSI